MTLLLWGMGDPPPPDPPEPPVVGPGDPITSDLPAPSYQVYAAMPDGTRLAQIADAIVVELEYPENRTGAFKVLVRRGSEGLEALRRDDGLPAIGVPEIHITRDWSLHPCWQGWPQVYTLDPVGGWFTIEGWDIMGRFGSLVFGDAERVNWVPNGDMEDGVGSWAAYDTAVLTSISDSARGAKAMRISVPAGQRPAWASRVVEVPESDQRTVWWASVWVRVPSGQVWPIEALAVGRIYDGDEDFVFWADMPSEQPLDEWVRLEVGPIGVDPGRAAQLSVRLHCRPGGTVDYDEARLSRNDNAGAVGGSDVTEAVMAGIRYIDEKAGLHLRFRGHLSGDELGATGYKWAFAEHAQATRAWEDHQGTVSMRFLHSSRTVEVGPALGRDLGVTLDDEVTSVTFTGEKIATAAISLGVAEGVTREEAGAVAAGEPLFEIVEKAPKGDLKDLDRRPAEVVAQRSTPAQVVKAKMPVPEGWRTSGDWIGLGLHPCDRVTAMPDADPFDLVSTQRIAVARLRPQDGDELQVELVQVT